MAKPTWLITNPATSGSGNGTIENSASEHTGRVARTGVVTVTADGLETPQTYNVEQTPKAEFVSFNNGTEMAVAKDGGQITVTGKSNSAALTFSFVGDAGKVEVPTNYTVASKETANGADIEGDPGAAAQYDFSVILTVPANETVEEISRTLRVAAKGGSQSTQIVLKQTAGDPTLSLEPTSITIPQAGTPAQTVNVTSNTSWTIS